MAAVATNQGEMKPMNKVFVFDAVRTPRGKGKSDGALNTIRPVDLLAPLFSELKNRWLGDRTGEVDDCVLGCVSPVQEQGANIARIAALHANWNEKVAGVTVNRFCASGLEAINIASHKVMAGQASLMVAGGVESMSRVPMGSDGGAYAQDPQIHSQLSFIPQGLSADLIATMEGFSRQEVDEFAVRSHKLAKQAWDDKFYASTVVPVKNGIGETVLAYDETIRADASAETLAQLKPAFSKIGEMGFAATALRRYPQVEFLQYVHHAGNSSGIVDGASLVLLGDERAAKLLKLKPRARIVHTAVIGTEPTIMLTGPTAVTQKALQAAGLTKDDIDVYEVNEAFASVVLKFAKDLSIPLTKINPRGGAIAMGHPLGATGAMLLATCIDHLHACQGRYGLVTLCVGAGMGICTIVERVV